MDAACAADGGGEDETLMDKASIIRLLRVFVGAVQPPDPDRQTPLLTDAPRGKREAWSPHSGGDASPSSPPPKRRRPSPPRASAAVAAAAAALPPNAAQNGDYGGEAPGNDQSLRGSEKVEPEPNKEGPNEEGEAAAAVATAAAAGGLIIAETVAARIDAGCTLWDMSVAEAQAAAICSAGLVSVSATVLRHCAEMGSAARATGYASPPAETAGGVVGLGEGVVGAGERGGGEREIVGVGVAKAGGGGEGVGEMEVERLREITCGLLANTCSHRSLRQDIFGDPDLAEELLGAFHATDDPACLTELLRLFSVAAMTLSPGTSKRDDSNDAATAGLAPGLMARETLQRLAIFLENSLEEKLLARACSMAYSLMYRLGDEGIRPLVEEFRLEESLASLLETRSTDLSYEQLGGVETGLDSLLRCLEVLSTSEASSIGPSSSTSQELSSVRSAVPAIPTGPCGKSLPEKEAGLDGSAGVTSTTRKTSCPAPQDAELAIGGRLSDIRTKVIKGLVGIMEPWEHARRSQRAALLVLGNVLDNVLEAAEEEPGKSGQTPRLVLECAAELESGLMRCYSAGENVEGGEEVEEAERDRVDRLTRNKAAFLDNVAGLVDGGGLSADNDGLGAELAEASTVVRKVLESSSG